MSLARADLNHPVADPDDAGDWSTLALIELRCREIARWVSAQIPVQPRRVLEVGCGNGYLSLELARAGHHVEAIDPSEARIAIANATLRQADRGPHFGSLVFRAIDAGSWKPRPIDVVVFNRSLHHLHGLDEFLTKVSGVLSAEGLVICNEYAWDHFDLRSAGWFSTNLEILLDEGLIDSKHPQKREELLESWKQEAVEENLARFDQMIHLLEKHFQVRSLSENPYLFANLAREIRTHDAGQEMMWTRKLLEEEKALIDSGGMRASGFRVVAGVPGTKS